NQGIPLPPGRKQYSSGVTALLVTCSLLGMQLAFGRDQDDSASKIQSIFEGYMGVRHQNKVDQALLTLDEAANIAESNEDTKLLLDVYHQYARIFLESGDRETALFYWDRASILLRETSYSFGQAFHSYLEAAIRF